MPMSSLSASAYKIMFLNSSSEVKVSASAPYSNFYNYFVSNDPKRWASHVPAYACLSYLNLYDGISLTVAQQGDNLKYDFTVDPFADPNLIRLSFDGVKSVSLVGGSLVINNFYSKIVELAPFAFQVVDGDTTVVPCQYVLDKNKVSFKLSSYRKDLPLIIDPVVVFSSFSGSTADNWGYTATYDAHGNLYGGGISFGVGYPTTLGAYQLDFCAGTGSSLTDVSISKFDSSGTSLIYSTYLGGSLVDIPHSLYVNDNNELYVFGTTASSNFPVTPNAFDTSFNGGPSTTLSTTLSFPNGSDIFVSKFSADGSQLLASTFVGGTHNDGVNTAAYLRKNYADDNRGEILVDEHSNVYVVSSTSSQDFPVTSNAYDTFPCGNQDVCVFKLNQDLSQLVWSTYFGGSANDAGYSMMLASDKSVYVCGGALSPNLPTSANAYQPVYATGTDGFVAHLSANGDQLLHCTYLGQQGYDQAYLIKGDRYDYPYVFGQTEASGNAWLHNANYFVPNGGQFLLKLTPGLDSLVWSTSFGTGNGGPDISPTALLVDYCNNIYMSGWGSSALNGFGGTEGLPITPDAFQSFTDGSDYYFLCLSDDASQLVYGSYFGGSANSAREHVDGGTSRFDRKGRIYQAVCAGCGGQSTFPTTNGAWSQTNGSSNCNLGVIKMDFGLPVVVADFELPNAICAPDSVHFLNHSQTIGSSTTYYWDFGDGSTSTLAAPTHFYDHTGYYRVTMVVQDNGSCNFADTLTKSILVLANSTDTLPTLSVCMGDFVQIGLPPSLDVDYYWSPAATLSSDNISNPFATPTQSTLYTLVATSGLCHDTLQQRVEVFHLNVDVMQDTTICEGGTAFLHIGTDDVSEIRAIEWSLSPTFTNVFNLNQTTLTVQPTEETTYYVRISGVSCIVESSITVHVSKIHVEAGQDFHICFENGVQLSLSHDGGANCQYSWTLGDGTVYYTAAPYVSPSESTTYSVTVTNPYGCSATTQGVITRRSGTFPMPLQAWCEICDIVQFNTTTIFSTDYGDGYTYQWTPTEQVTTPQSPSTLVQPMSSTTYTVAVTDTFNCTLTDTVFIKVETLTCDNPFVYVPNAFSPNGDSKNDVLYVRSSIVDNLYFVIYSRWGQKIFETTSMENGWDGTFKGKPCQNGVYDYYLKATCLDGQVLETKGNVMLVR
ncbi:MAG: gliding motility-associated C-terminal domain-containing protein [Bacteroidales bacterium]|nr:gliding motility-associated C-terminal domain-containing protein [Bacteroidales bacterium]